MGGRFWDRGRITMLVSGSQFGRGLTQVQTVDHRTVRSDVGVVFQPSVGKPKHRNQSSNQ